MDRRLVDVSQAGNIEAFYALLEDEPHVLDFVDEVPYTRTPLHLAVLARKTEFAKEIASLRPSFMTKIDRYGYNPIHLAAENGQVEMVKMLLEKLDTKDELLTTKGKENRTPLHVAVISGKIEVVKFLVKYYPSCIMDTTIRGETALHVAVKSKQLDALLVLLEQLIKLNESKKVTSDVDDVLNYKDVEGNTILHLATMLQQQEMVEALMNTCTNSAATLRVDVSSLNGNNCTALDIILQIPEDKRNSKIQDLLTIS